MKLKKAVLGILAILAISVMVCAMQTEPASAVKAGFSHDSYTLANAVTLDGKWTGTGNTEWNDAKQEIITANSAIFRSKEVIDIAASPMTVKEYYLIEIVTDTTNNAGDYVELAYDGLGDNSGAPATDDIKVTVTGHPGTLAVFSGTGTAWATKTFTSDNVQVVSTFTATPLSSTPHWCYELMVEKIGWNIGQNYNLFVATYDAGNTAAGIQAWPLASTDMVPNNFGAVLGGATKPDGFVQNNDIPEGFGLGIIVALTTIAAVAGAFYFRKHSKAPNAPLLKF
jgi:hypothetical protein